MIPGVVTLDRDREIGTKGNQEGWPLWVNQNPTEMTGEGQCAGNN